MSSGDNSASPGLFADKLEDPDTAKKPNENLSLEQKVPDTGKATKVPAPTAENKDKIVVIDDSPTILTVISGILKRVGFNALTFRSGQAALADLQKMTPDELKNVQAIFSDFEMPNMNGLEILTTIREIEALKAIPFIMITGHTKRETIQKAAQLKVNGYLLKPISTETLVSTLNNLFPGQIALPPSMTAKSGKTRYTAAHKFVDMMVIEKAAYNPLCFAVMF